MVIRSFFVVSRMMKHYGKQNVMRLIVLLATLFTMIPAQALLTAGVNRTVIADYESVELTLRSDTDTDAAPDLKPLEKDFDILGTRQSRQVRIINGKSESWRDWIVTLMPKRVGSLVIPSLALGSERSEPVNIDVRNDLKTDGNSGKPVLIQTDINSKEVYVQQEILFTLQILYRVNLYEDSRLTPLAIDNAMVKQLGETEKFDTVVDGVRYKVFQLRYSIHPQEEGTLEIPSLAFSAVTASNEDPFNSIFSRPGKPIVVRSEPIKIEVKPRPANYQKQWLPARDLRLQEIWSQPLDSLKVGDAITRTITIEADGLSSAQLPPVFLAQPEGVNSYPDKSSSEDFHTKEGIRGQRTDAIAMIPTKPGTIQLPAVQYSWFNARTNRTEVAEIPERTINVMPALDSPHPSDAPSEQKAASVQEDRECPVSDISGSESPTPQSRIWKIISLILALLWLATGVFWWLTRTKQAGTTTSAETLPITVPQNVQEKNAFKQLETACKKGHLNEVRQALHNWCVVYLDRPGLNSVEQCLQEINSQPLSDFYQQLSTYLYSSNTASIDLDAGLKICRSLRKKKPSAPDSDSALTELYPG